MKTDLFKKPQFILEAAQEQKGLIWYFEILLFTGILVLSLLLDALFINLGKPLSDLINSIIGGEMITHDADQIFTLLAETFTIIGVIFFCKIVQKREMYTIGFTLEEKDEKKQACIKGWLLGAGIGSLVIITIIFNGGMETPSFAFKYSKFLPILTHIVTLLLYIVGYMIFAVSRIILFDGYFLISFSRKCPLYLSIIASSLLFGVVSFSLNSETTTLALFSYILLGIFLSLLFIYSQNIWFPSAFYAGFLFFQKHIFGAYPKSPEFTNKSSDKFKLYTNLFSTNYKPKHLLSSGSEYGIEASVIFMIILLIGCIILFVLNKPKSQPLEIPKTFAEDDGSDDDYNYNNNGEYAPNYYSNEYNANPQYNDNVQHNPNYNNYDNYDNMNYNEQTQQYVPNRHQNDNMNYNPNNRRNNNVNRNNMVNRSNNMNYPNNNGMNNRNNNMNYSNNNRMNNRNNNMNYNNSNGMNNRNNNMNYNNNNSMNNRNQPNNRY